MLYLLMFKFLRLLKLKSFLKSQFEFHRPYFIKKGLFLSQFFQALRKHLFQIGLGRLCLIFQV